MFGRSKCAAKLSWYCLESCRTVKKGANLPIVLKKEVEGLGPAGENIRVNPGFAHNWLLPKRLAIYDIAANHGGRRRSRITQVAKTGQSSKSAAVSAEQRQLEQVLNKLLSSPVTVKRKKKGGNAIEGQVTVASIADAIAKQKRIDLAKEVIELQSPIIQHGTFDVPLAIILASGEQAVLKLVVAP